MARSGKTLLKPDQRKYKSLVKTYYGYSYDIRTCEIRHEAFYTRASRDAWVEDNPDRYPTQIRDMTRPEIKEARWWIDTKIG